MSEEVYINDLRLGQKVRIRVKSDDPWATGKITLVSPNGLSLGVYLDDGLRDGTGFFIGAIALLIDLASEKVINIATGSECELQVEPRYVPGYWKDETSGVLQPAIIDYLNRRPLTVEQIGAIRAYFRQWINAPDFQGEDVESLRRLVDIVENRASIDMWLHAAEDAGIDPL